MDEYAQLPVVMPSHATSLNQYSAWRHVVTRALALVVMGVLMVNAEHGVGGVLGIAFVLVIVRLGRTRRGGDE